MPNPRRTHLGPSRVPRWGSVADRRGRRVALSTPPTPTTPQPRPPPCRSTPGPTSTVGGAHAKGRDRARDRAGPAGRGCRGRAGQGQDPGDPGADRRVGGGDPGDRGLQLVVADDPGGGADLPAGAARGPVAAGAGADAGPDRIQRVLGQPARGGRDHPGRDLRVRVRLRQPAQPGDARVLLPAAAAQLVLVGDAGRLQPLGHPALHLRREPVEEPAGRVPLRGGDRLQLPAARLQEGQRHLPAPADRRADRGLRLAAAQGPGGRAALDPARDRIATGPAAYLNGL